MDGFGQSGTAASLAWVRGVEKGLGLLVVGLGDRVHSDLAGGKDGRADCDVDLNGATRSRRDDNGVVRG
jgi:hypothetical protein